MICLRRWLGLVVMLVSLAVLLCYVAAIVGVWQMKRDMPPRIDTVVEKLDSGLNRISNASGNLHRSVGTIRADVKLVQDDRSNLDPGEERNRLVAEYFRTVVERFRLLSEAAGGVTGAIQTIPDLPLGGSGSLDRSKMDELATHCTELSITVERLQARLGTNAKEVSENDLVAAASDIQTGLEICDVLTDGFEHELASARSALLERKTAMLRWLDAVALTVTIVGGWLALGQVCLFCRGWRWCFALGPRVESANSSLRQPVEDKGDSVVSVGLDKIG